MADKKLDFGHLMVEAILIVFTVLLALTLNEWRTNVKERKIKDKALKNIISEIRSNKEDIESKLDYHLQTSEKIRLYMSNDSLWTSLNPSSGIEAVSTIMTRGIANPNLQSGAWNSAVLSGVVNSFEYDVLYELSNLYQIQENGPNSTWKIMAGFFSESSSFDPANARQVTMKFQLAFRELYSQERSLLKDYEKALSLLEAS